MYVVYEGVRCCLNQEPTSIARVAAILQVTKAKTTAFSTACCFSGEEARLAEQAYRAGNWSPGKRARSSKRELRTTEVVVLPMPARDLRQACKCSGAVKAMRISAQ